MRHKYIILGLSVILIILIVAKGYEPTQFPLRIEHYDYAYGSNGEQRLTKKSDKLIAFRTQQKFSDIPWDGFSIGDSVEDVDTNSKHTTDSTIMLDGKIFNTSVRKYFSQSGELMEIALRFRNASQVTSDIIAMFGSNYLQLYEYNDRMRKNTSERYFWIKNTTLVIYEIERLGYDDGFLAIADISDFTDAELKRFIRYGHAQSKYEPNLQSFLEKERTPRNTALPTTTKKYGDSDTYQGSSKQKEDLEAIDKYFGL